MRQNQFHPLRMVVIGWIVLLCWVREVRSDEIQIDKSRYQNVTIRSFDGEFVVFVKSNGESAAKRVPEMTSIFVDSVQGMEEFNRAEQAFVQKKYRDAQSQYLLALPRAKQFWKDLIQVRHLQVSDLAGDLEKAVDSYLTLVERWPEKADAYMPTHIDAATAQSQERAMERVVQKMASTDNQLVYWNLEALRLSILEQSESEDAGKVAQEIMTKLQQSPNPQSRYRLQMIAIRVEVKHKQYQAALEHIDEAIVEADERYLPELLFLKGQCLFETAQAREDYIRSGLAFMRVVIHFSKSRYVAESMYWTGRVHEQINRAQKALELYENCTELPGADDKIVNLAKTAIARIRNEQSVRQPSIEKG